MLEEISHMKDLKNVSFSELVEAFVNNQAMGFQQARPLIERIDERYLSRLDSQRLRSARYFILQGYLSHIRTIYNKARDKPQWESLARRAASNRLSLELRMVDESAIMGVALMLNDPVDSFLSKDVELILERVEQEFLLEGQGAWRNGVSEFDSLDKNLSVLARRVKDDSTITLRQDYPEKLAIRSPFALLVCVNDELYQEIIKLISNRMECDLLDVLHENRVAGGILLLPELDSDQDLALYLGSTFHATLSDVDAYTGALYASEYFDVNRNVFERCLLRFTHNELELAWDEVQEQANEVERSWAIAQDALSIANKYKKAMKYFQKENDENAARQAFELFSELSDFRDANQLSREAKARWTRLSGARQLRENAEAILKQVRKYIPGQFADLYSKWKILEIDVEGQKALVTTEEGIACMPWGDGTWSECRLRRWLNEEFYATIPRELREKIVATDVVDLDISKECQIRDKVFLLSAEEVAQYYYVQDRYLPEWGHSSSESIMDSAMWVRGRGSGAKVRIFSKNRFSERDQNSEIGVRPAVWVRLDGINDEEGDVSAVDRYALASEAFRKKDYLKAEELFASSNGFSDSAQRACLAKALRLFNEAEQLDRMAKTESDLRQAAAAYESSAQVNLCADDLTIPLDMIYRFRFDLPWYQERAIRCLENADILRRSSLLCDIATLRFQQKEVQKRKEEKTPLERLVEDARSRIAEAKNELASLKFFQRNKKRKVIDRIQELTTRLTRLEKQAASERMALNQECKKEVIAIRERQQVANQLFLRTASVGDMIRFGHWSQNVTNGPSKRDVSYALSWIICEKKEKRILLWCVSLADTYLFADRDKKKLSWGKSSVRKWLNKSFVKEAFDASEMTIIAQQPIDNIKTRAFLPSKEELLSYEQLRARKQTGPACWTRDVQDSDFVLAYQCVADDDELSVSFRRERCGTKLEVEPMIWIELP